VHSPCLKELFRVGEIVVLIDAFGVQRHTPSYQLHQQILQKGAGIVVVVELPIAVAAALTAVLSFRRPLTADECRFELRDIELLEAEDGVEEGAEVGNGRHLGEALHLFQHVFHRHLLKINQNED
jgi:hypothetical protein